MWPWLVVSGVIVLLDQASKVWAEATLALHEAVAVVPLLNFRLTYNPGAAFSFLGDAGGWHRWLFVALSTAISLYIVWWLRSVANEKLQPLALSLILGGAIGNLVDRVRIGAVVDFIDVYYGQSHFPTFNIADSGVTVGAGLLIVGLLRGSRSDT
ncbi:MAG: signal peptidase II [Gammaproteobacteria bacterium]|nr:signal peptidase II [Gammaproteobacteria bacterium]